MHSRSCFASACTLRDRSSRPVRNSNQASAGITIKLATAMPMPTGL